MIQGHNGIATVDEKHQIVVDAQAFGDGHEAKHVGEVVEQVASTFRKLDPKLDIYKKAVLTADTGPARRGEVRAGEPVPTQINGEATPVAGTAIRGAGGRANITATMGLDRFSLRGRKKVDTQWKLFCTVHNIGKITARWRKT